MLNILKKIYIRIIYILNNVNNFLITSIKIYFFFLRNYFIKFLENTYIVTIVDYLKIRQVLKNKKLLIVFLLFHCICFSLYKIGNIPEFYHYWGIIYLFKNSEFLFIFSFFFTLVYSIFFFFNFFTDYLPEYIYRIKIIFILILFLLFFTII